MPRPPQVGLHEVIMEREPPVPRRIARTTAAITCRRCGEVSRPLRGPPQRLRQLAHLLLRADLRHDDPLAPALRKFVYDLFVTSFSPYKHETPEVQISATYASPILHAAASKLG